MLAGNRYMMREEHAFPEGVDLVKVLESYFQYCSLEMDCEAMSVVAATLANGGVCPTTGERVFAAQTVQRVLSVMQVAGMYDYSGEFAFRVGFPCKSGVSGVLCIVIPGVCGIATFSPRLDALGNSVKGIRFCHALNMRFPFHEFASLRGCHQGRDVTTPSLTAKGNMTQRSGSGSSSGSSLRLSPTHRASSSSSRSSLSFSASQGYSRGHSSSSPCQSHGENPTDVSSQLSLVSTLWYAAAAGELMLLRQLAAAGVDVNIADYDRRSALHLAASEGKVGAVRYLLALGADASYTDRYGNRALEDSVREGHEAVELVLRQHMGEMAGYMWYEEEEQPARSGNTDGDGNGDVGGDAGTGRSDTRTRIHMEGRNGGFQIVYVCKSTGHENTAGYTNDGDDADEDVQQYTHTDADVVAVVDTVPARMSSPLFVTTAATTMGGSQQRKQRREEVDEVADHKNKLQQEHSHAQQQQRGLYRGNVRWLRLLLRSTQFVSRALIRPLPLAGPTCPLSKGERMEGQGEDESAVVFELRKHADAQRGGVVAETDADVPAASVPMLYGKMMYKSDLLHMLQQQGIRVGTNINLDTGTGICTGRTTGQRATLVAQLDSLPDFFNRRCFMQRCVDPCGDPTIIKCLTGQLAVPHFPRFKRKVREVFLDATGSKVGVKGSLGSGIGDKNVDGRSGTTAGASVDMCTVDGQQLHLDGSASSRSPDPQQVLQWVQLQDLVRPVIYCLALEQHAQTRLSTIAATTAAGDAGCAAHIASDGGGEVCSTSTMATSVRVHDHVGREPAPSDAADTELNSDGVPFNPFTTSGAVMTMALLRPVMDASTCGDSSSGTNGGSGGNDSLGKVRAVQSLLTRMQGGLPCRIGNGADGCTDTDTDTGNSRTSTDERSRADHKEKAVSYLMKASGCMGADVDVDALLDVHFMCHALESTSEGLATLAATLANGGVCPTTGERVLSGAVVRACLSLMHTAGMGSISGEFQFRIGIPSKCAQGSGGGAMLVAVPNVLGICYITGHVGDAADRCTDSGRGTGLSFCEGLVKCFAFHRHDAATWANNGNNSDNIGDGVGGDTGRVERKEDPTQRVVHWERDASSHTQSTAPAAVTQLLSAAAVGDTMAIKAMHAAGCHLGCADYDMRTAAHLAAATGNLDVLRYFADHGVDLDARDRWGGTPLDDAEHEGHADVAQNLRVWLGLPESVEGGEGGGEGGGGGGERRGGCSLN